MVTTKRTLVLVVLVLAVGAQAAWAQPLKTVKVLCDRAPDCSSLKSAIDSVTRGCKSDDERVIAIYNFCRYIYYHHAYPNEPGGISALKFINVYGWGLCGGQHTVQAALWEAAGYKWRFVGWSGHTTVEVSYGGRWHYLDTFLKFYCWTPASGVPGGRTIASQEDIKTNPALVNDGFVMDQERKVCYQKDNRFAYVGAKVNWTAPAFMVCGDTLDGVVGGVRTKHDAGSPRGWATVCFDDPKYSTSVDLSPGYALTLDWDKQEGAWYFRGSKKPPGHTCGDKDYRNCPAIGPLLEPYHAKGRARSYSNGTLVFRPDLATDAFLAALKDTANLDWQAGTLKPKQADQPATFVVEMASPYVVAKASGKLACEGATAEVSTDDKTWKPADLPTGQAGLADFSQAVAGSYRYLVRVTLRKPLTAIELTSVVQHNQEASPYLAPGANTITVTAANPEALGKNRLVVTYAYCPGSRDRTPEEVYDRGAEIGRAHYATWSDKPVVVQKTVDKFPFTFEIPVATPKGKQPVYPRMVFLRREVLAPGSEPLAVPAPPSTPQAGAGETLATLPNPWAIGTQKPQAAPDRPTKATVYPCARTLYCTMKGEVFGHQFVKWLKDNSNAWIFLVGFDVGKLPDAKSLASAKLVLYVQEAHDKAPMQVSAVALKAPFEPGKAYDFSKLGQMLGSTTVDKGEGPGKLFDPPRRYEIDVTRAVRAWAGGEKPHELAVRIVPNRGIDDGWTVRFTPAKAKPAELVVSTYEKE